MNHALTVLLRLRAMATAIVAGLVLAGSASGQCTPTILGSVDTPGNANGVTVSGTVAYVADQLSGLQVIDVSDPAAPTIIGSVDTPGAAIRVAVLGTVAYVADGDSGLQVIDVSDPADPTILGSVDTPYSAFDAAVSGTVAYVADGFSGLQVIDVSDPADPAIIGSVDTPGAAWGVAVSGTLAYMTQVNIPNIPPSLYVIDVSDPADPTILGSVVTPGEARGVAVSGTVAYVADDTSGLQVIDVSDPADPTILGSVDTPGHANDVAISGTVVYVGDGESGLQVIDVSDPTDPTILGSVDTPGDAFGVAVSGTVVYVADAIFGGLQLVDVSSCATATNFDDPVEIPSDGEPIIHDTGDLDGDGDEDVVVVIPDVDPMVAGVVQVFLNQGTDVDGTWLGFLANTPIPVGLDPSGVAVGLYDADLLLDLAVTNAGDDNVFVFFNDGSGNATFGTPVSVPVGDLPLAIATANFGGNASTDLAVANGTDGTVFILDNDGTGVFTMSVEIMSGGLPCEVDPADVDNDKDTDLVIARCTDQSLDVWLNGPAPGIINIPISSDPRDLATADIDGNGWIDIMSANAGGAVSVVLNDGGLVFQAPVDVPVGADPRSVDAADLNGDFQPDLAVVADDPDIGPAVQVLANTSGGEGVDFAEPLAFGVDADPNFVVAVDLNGDGAIDLVTSNMDDGKTGGSVTGLISDPPAPECPGDVDGDGDVGFQDLLQVLGSWGQCPDPCPPTCVGDVAGAGDCLVGFDDLLFLLASWGSCVE